MEIVAQTSRWVGGVHSSVFQLTVTLSALSLQAEASWGLSSQVFLEVRRPPCEPGGWNRTLTERLWQAKACHTFSPTPAFAPTWGVFSPR